MVQNLKVDIIYHQTVSDFEMEFNLCGCCRMRLLNDKTTDKKGFVKALARDVSRSRVIIACGPLFGDDGIIKIVAAAIGNGVSVCDNKTYGINSDEKIEIIKGSTPLVTSDGYFGGCIIESGPQTIILLTENKTFRKSIMQNLIHPYIEDISYIQPKANDFQPAEVRNEPAPIETLPESDIEAGYLTEVDDGYEEAKSEDFYKAATQDADAHNIDFVMDEPDVEEQNGQPYNSETVSESIPFDGLYTGAEDIENVKERYEQSYIPSESDNMYISSVDDDDEVPSKKSKKSQRSLNITMIVLVVFLLLAILVLVYFVIIKPYTIGISTGDYLKDIFNASSEKLTF